MGRAFGMAVSFLAAALAAGCGDTLVDSSATVLVQPSSCSSDTSCGDGIVCRDCTAAAGLPASAQGVCLPAAGGAFACGFACTGGLLKCGDGCCRATEVASGGRHACAITEVGGLVCWGLNDWLQVNPAAPADVLGPQTAYPVGVTAVAAGDSHTCAVVNGTVQCWGWPTQGQTRPPSPLAGVTALAAGRSHTCALVGDTGQVRCWGTDALGQTAGGTPIAAGATAISAGRDHTCATIGATGAVVCWGANDQAQIGRGTEGGASEPFTTLPAGVAHVAAGTSHACAAAETPVELPGGNVEDAVRCWGAEPGPEFLLASPQLTPAIPLKDADTSVVRFTVAALSTGRTHVCARRAGAAEGIVCFGAENDRFQLGQRTPPGLEREALDVSGSLGAIALSAGADHTCAIWDAGGVHCWGSNEHGQLGLGTSDVQPESAVAVSGR